MSCEMGQIVDLERYPIDRIDSPEAQQLLRRCRQSTNETALCLLPGFVQSDMVEVMANELGELVTQASRYDEDIRKR